jgi:hypothetical protein
MNLETKIALLDSRLKPGQSMTYLTKAMALVEWALTSGLTENCLPACSPLDAKFELDVCEVNKVMFC